MLAGCLSTLALLPSSCHGLAVFFLLYVLTLPSSPLLWNPLSLISGFTSQPLTFCTSLVAVTYTWGFIPSLLTAKSFWKRRRERDRVLVVFLCSTCRLEPEKKHSSLLCLVPFLTKQERKAKGRSIRRWWDTEQPFYHKGWHLLLLLRNCHP